MRKKQHKDIRINWKLVIIVNSNLPQNSLKIHNANTKKQKMH